VRDAARHPLATGLMHAGANARAFHVRPAMIRLLRPQVVRHRPCGLIVVYFVAGVAGAVPGMAGMEQMLRPMLRTSGASMFGLQLGQGLGQLATEVVGATDIGLPLSEPGHVALLPTNVAAFGKGLEQWPACHVDGCEVLVRNRTGCAV
jgi:hypothetical protein